METYNYSIFKYIDTNRKINNSLVQKLIVSIQSIGYIKARPIIVDKNMTIIDGQHRFEACKRLNIPIHYETSSVDMTKAMIALNMNQQIWKLNEYVESYAKQGIYCYKYVLTFERKYKLGMTNSICICLGSGYQISTKIRNGVEFEINPNANLIANFLIKCKNFLPFYKHSKFVQSIESLFKKTTLENCNKVFEKIQPLRQQSKITDYLSYYENILNRYKRSTDKKITLL